MRATVFGSVNGSNEMLWQHAEAAGFEVRVVERAANGREKRVDTGVVTRICRDAYLLGQPGRDRITLVAGDGDYEPLVRQLVADGFEVTLLSWSHASCELQAVASRFYPQNAYLQELVLRCEPAAARPAGPYPQIAGTKLWISGWTGCAGQGRVVLERPLDGPGAQAGSPWFGPGVP